jgi:tetratricopeptide (TPR) repeat protein
MILKGELTPLGNLSGAFLAPKNGQYLQFAYYESSLVVEYIVQNYGLDALKGILKDLGDGKEINAAIVAHTTALANLEKQFDAFARGKAQNLAPGVDLEKPPDAGKSEAAMAEMMQGGRRPRPGFAPAGGAAQPMAASAWELAHPKNYYVRLEAAQKMMEANDWTNARPALESLMADYHGEHRGDNPIWLLAVTEGHLNDTNAEYATLQKFADQESDFVDLYVKLIELAGDRKDWPAEKKYAEMLLAVNPLIPAPYAALAEAGSASGQNDVAIEAYRKLLLLDPPDVAEVHFRLAKLLHARGNSEKEAKRHVLQALEEAPRFREAQKLLLDIKGKEGAS